MRILSQNNNYDIEYENCHLVVNEKCCEIEAETSNPNFTPVTASYSSVEKCRKAMEMLHVAYFGEDYLKYRDCKIENIEMTQELEEKIREEMLKPHFLEVKPNNPVVECKIFQFPSDDEVEG